MPVSTPAPSRAAPRSSGASPALIGLVGMLSGASTMSAHGQPMSSSSARPVAEATELATAPTIDGRVLGDPAWEGVPVIDSFWQIQPQAGRPASQRTEVYLGFTESALYIGLVAYDEAPLGIISSDSRRDASLDDSDSFRVLIDGLLDRQNGYVFGTNPAGIEYDGQVGRDGSFNLNWDGVWTVRTEVSDIGWSAEMEIPFASLRYGSGSVQTWGFNFERRIRRNNEVAYWAPLSQERNLYRVSEAGFVEGIRVPRQRNLQLTPYVLGRVARGGESGRRRSEDAGFDLKYSLTPSLTLDATYNTDFAQVEADEQQVNLDRFSLFFPEKRAFFLENSGLFTVGNSREAELFFSRRIGIAAGTPIPIEHGVRLSGKIGPRMNVGLLRMSSESVDGLAPANDYTVARVSRELPNRSSVGALFVGRDGDGSLVNSARDDRNRAYAVDGRFGIGSNATIQAWAARTDTPGLIGRDDAFAVSGNYSDADWTFNLGYTEVGESFNPEVGFLSRRNYRKIDGSVFRRIRPANFGNFFEIRPHMVYRGYWDFDGFQETGFLHLDAHWQYRSSHEFHTGYNFTREGLKEPFEIVPGVMVEAGTYDHRELQLVYIGNRSAPVNFELRSFIGGRFGGDRVTLEPTLRYRIGNRFISEFAFNYNEFDLPVAGGDFTANLWRMRVSYSFSPRMQLQMLMQYSEQSDTLSTNLRFAWLQSANAGLYLVYNEVDERGIGGLPRGREVVLKYSRILDLLR